MEIVFLEHHPVPSFSFLLPIKKKVIYSLLPFFYSLMLMLLLTPLYGSCTQQSYIYQVIISFNITNLCFKSIF